MTQFLARTDGTDTDITEAVQLLAEALRYTEYIDWDRAEEDAVLAAVEALDLDDDHPLLAVATRVRREREEREAAQRRRDEYERTEAERRAQRIKAAHQLAEEMRASDPALVRAGWSDAELVELHRMRNSGIA
jgi:hypothetical protein